MAPRADSTDEIEPQSNKDIINLDIEQLGKVSVRTNPVAPTMDTEVTSVTKQESSVARSASAVYVITSEMIARSGCNHVPDLLRMVPGLEVARIDAHSWVVTSRGFSSRFSNMLLVLVDGRIVYTPTTSCVYWDIQDVLMEDIDRIEVIRGPGATIYGNNAVNGVINIITKKTSDTKESLVTYGGGTEDLALGGFRFSGGNGEGFNYRIYGRHQEEAGGWSATGTFDDWREGVAGFRADWELDREKKNIFTFQGDYYVAREGNRFLVTQPTDPWQQVVDEDEAPTGGNILGRFTHIIDEESDYSVQAYFDQFQREVGWWDQNVTTVDVQFQHRFPIQLARRHELIWGCEYRQSHDEESVGFMAAFDPPKATNSLLDFFVQDEIMLVEDRWYFTLGTKIGRNSFTGIEYQPSARLLFTPDKQHSLWAAISRSVWTPYRFSQNGAITYPPMNPNPPPQMFLRYVGNPDLASVDMMAYELGYRTQATERFAYDIALFLNHYSNVANVTMLTPYDDPYGNQIYPETVVNQPFASWDTSGVELSGQYTLSETWRLSASYTFLNAVTSPTSQILFLGGLDPQNQARFVSSWDLGKNWQFDMAFRYVDEIPTFQIPSYLTMDMRLAWTPNKHVELALYGRNLLQDHHAEFRDTFYPMYLLTDSEVRRSVFGKLTYRY